MNEAPTTSAPIAEGPALLRSGLAHVAPRATFTSATVARQVRVAAPHAPTVPTAGTAPTMAHVMRRKWYDANSLLHDANDRGRGAACDWSCRRK